MDKRTEQMSEDELDEAVTSELLDCLARGEEAGFWGEGETKGEGEPRLTMWAADGRFYLKGRGGVDYGAFGSIIVALRFMAPIMRAKLERGG